MEGSDEVTYDVKLTDFITEKEFLKRSGTDVGGHVQKAVDAAVIRYCSPYVPFEEGILEGSAAVATRLGSGEVSYDTPYARYLYYGEIYGPNIPIVENGNIVGWCSPPEKHPTVREIQYSTAVNPQAGSHWFDRSMADHKEDVLEEAQNAADCRSYP